MTARKPKQDPETYTLTFHLDVEFENMVPLDELLNAVTELIEKAREQGRPTKATLIGFPSVMEIPV